MDTNILVALAPIIVAIGGGLAFLAYNHPRGYGVMSWWLLSIWEVIFVGGVVWEVSRLKTYGAVLQSHVVFSTKLTNYKPPRMPFRHRGGGSRRYLVCFCTGRSWQVSPIGCLT
jgi:hypothetical protein